MSECQGDVSDDCCHLGGGSDAGASQPGGQGLNQLPATALVLLTGTGKHRGGPFLFLPAFFSPSSASCWQNLPGD